jgi:tetratricopeptide (TPR) repeat protein
LSLTLTGLSQAIKPIQDSNDLLKAIISLPSDAHQKAIKLLDEGKSLIGDVFFRGLLIEAEKAHNAKDPARWRFLLEVLEAASERSGNSFVRALTFNHFGKLYHEARQPQKAIEAYQHSIRVCLESDLKPSDNRSNLHRVLAMSLYELGRLQFETSDFRNAIESYDRSFKAFEEINSKRDCIQILNDLERCTLYTGDYKTAKEVSQRSLLSQHLSSREMNHQPIPGIAGQSPVQSGLHQYLGRRLPSCIDFAEVDRAL